MNPVLLIFIGVIGVSTPFLFNGDSPEWDGLKVTWGQLGFFNGYFNSMPRTVYAAHSQQFVKVSDCDESSPFRGSRYVQDGDKSLVLLYDKNGYIAGIQTMVPKGQPFGYPERGLVPPFVEMDDGYYLTAYFVPPGMICSDGRTGEEFDDQGTGTDLYIQIGNNPDVDYIIIPHYERELTSTNWVEGNCFFTMGKHYWYDISRDMNCDNFFPVFILYNGGKLNAFGWALGANLPSPYLEHPPPAAFPVFFKDIPRCLSTRGRMSTMHVFLNDWPYSNVC